MIDLVSAARLPIAALRVYGHGADARFGLTRCKYRRGARLGAERLALSLSLSRSLTLTPTLTPSDAWPQALHPFKPKPSAKLGRPGHDHKPQCRDATTVSGYLAESRDGSADLWLVHGFKDSGGARALNSATNAACNPKAITTDCGWPMR